MISSGNFAFTYEENGIYRAQISEKWLNTGIIFWDYNEYSGNVLNNFQSASQTIAGKVFAKRDLLRTPS